MPISSFYWDKMILTLCQFYLVNINRKKSLVDDLNDEPKGDASRFMLMR